MTANKALLAALLAGLTSILADLRGADSTLTVQDWVVTVLAALVAGIGVYIIPNRALPHRGQHGHIDTFGLIVGVLIIIVLLVVLFRLL